MSEKRYELPEGWVWSTLGEVCEKSQYGWTTSADFSGRGLKLLRTSDISSGVIDWNTVPFCEKEPDDSQKYLLKSGDILVSRAGSVGLSIEIDNCPKAVFASYLIRFRPKPSISSKFVSFYLKSPYYWDSIADNTAGIAIPNVNATKLSALEIPLPPKEEQERIVNKIESLLNNLTQVKQSLAQIPPLLKKFRQSVLAKAFRGELTEDWRDKQANLEPASTLLERIREERKKLLGKKYKELESLDTSELPEGWICIRIGDLASVVTKGSTPTSYGFEYQERGILFVKVENISDYSIQHGTITQFISKETHKFLGRSQLQEDDILFSIAGTIGRVCILKKEDLPANTNQALAIIRIPSPSVDKNYLLYYLDSRVAQDSARGEMRGVGIYNISLEDVKNIDVALPPLAEQKQIVKKIQDFFAQANAIEKSVKIAQAHCEKLTQSILGKAFRGELTEKN